TIGFQSLVPEGLGDGRERAIERAEAHLVEQHTHDHIRQVVPAVLADFPAGAAIEKAPDEIPDTHGGEFLRARQHEVGGVVAQVAVGQPARHPARAQKASQPGALLLRRAYAAHTTHSDWLRYSPMFAVTL